MSNQDRVHGCSGSIYRSFCVRADPVEVTQLDLLGLVSLLGEWFLGRLPPIG